MKDRKTPEQYIPMAKSIARRYMQPALSYDDLVQEGLLALIEAEDKYNPKKKAKHSTFVYAVMKNRILSYLNKEKKNHYNTYPLDEKITEDFKRARKGSSFNIPDDIPKMEKEVLSLMYKQGKTLKEISVHFGISREKTRQLKSLALRRLKINKKLTKSLYAVNSN
jgi:RNA polymerase sporulation-specific sigma factor